MTRVLVVDDSAVDLRWPARFSGATRVSPSSTPTTAKKRWKRSAALRRNWF